MAAYQNYIMNAYAWVLIGMLYRLPYLAGLQQEAPLRNSASSLAPSPAYLGPVAPMCGIAGLITASSAERFVPAAELMASAMRHRGPDSQGVAALGECLLVNARLAAWI